MLLAEAEVRHCIVQHRAAWVELQRSSLLLPIGRRSGQPAPPPPSCPRPAPLPARPRRRGEGRRADAPAPTPLCTSPLCSPLPTRCPGSHGEGVGGSTPRMEEPSPGAGLCSRPEECRQRPVCGWQVEWQPPRRSSGGGRGITITPSPRRVPAAAPSPRQQPARGWPREQASPTGSHIFHIIRRLFSTLQATSSTVSLRLAMAAQGVARLASPWLAKATRPPHTELSWGAGSGLAQGARVLLSRRVHSGL